MVIIRPRIWYVCDKCHEWFIGKQFKSDMHCPECKKGILEKTCGFCGENYLECQCTEKELSAKCHDCGFRNNLCVCNSKK